MAAVLLTVVGDEPPIPIASLPPVSDLINVLDAAALRALLERLIDTRPPLIDTVDEVCGVAST